MAAAKIFEFKSKFTPWETTNYALAAQNRINNQMRKNREFMTKNLKGIQVQEANLLTKENDLVKLNTNLVGQSILGSMMGSTFRRTTGKMNRSGLSNK